MVAAVSTTLNPKAASQGGGRPQNGTRPPLLPSDPENGAVPRRLKSREVTSRYMSSSSSASTASSTCSNLKRCPSPLVSRTAAASPMPTPQSLRRSQSVERRRAVTPRPNSLDLRIGNGAAGVGEMSAAQKLLVTSTRSLSVSFQGESYSLQVSKAKRAPSPNARKGTGTPERRKASTPARPDQSENSRPMEQYRWPARLRPDTCMTRSLDCTVERKKVNGSGSNVVRALQNSLGNDLDGRLRSSSCNLGSVKASEPVDEANSVRVTQSEAVASSDTDSMSSGSSNSGPHELGGGGSNCSGSVGQPPRPRGIVVPARFWQETNNLLRRQSESKGCGARPMTSPKVNEANRLSIDSPVSSPRGVVNNRGQLSPIRGTARPASPSKLSRPSVSSPLRGVSPSRARNGVSATPSSNLSNMPSVLSFGADVRRGKIGENRIVDAHVVRLLHNRLLQWRFVNARANAALAAQRSNAEVWSPGLKLQCLEIRANMFFYSGWHKFLLFL